jgi:hypothetical protein
LKDGRDKLLLNRDDQAGFRLTRLLPMNKGNALLWKMSLRLQQELISLINIHPFFKQRRICSWRLKRQKKPVSES